MEAWARYRGVEILRFHTDLDVSGSKLSRPALDEAIGRAETGVSDGILVARLDRFARNLTGAMETIRRLEKVGATVVSVAEGLDPATPAGKMLMRVMLMTAEFELDGIRESWDQSRRRAVARGRHLGSVPPTGYRRGRSGRLALDPVAAPALAELFRMRASYRSWHEMHAHVAASGLKNPFGTARWTTASLLEVMANRVYLGESHCGPHHNRSAHQPLIDRGTWELAQMTKTLTATGSRRPALLSGLLRCAGCRYVMASSGQREGSPDTARKYRCPDRAPGGCPICAVIDGAEIEDLVVAKFFEMYEGSPLRRAASAGRVTRAEAGLVAAERRLGLLMDGANDPTEAVEREQAEAEASVRAARETLVVLARSKLAPGPAALRNRWSRLPVGERRRLLALMIDSVVVREDRGLGAADRVLVMPFGEGPQELPARGKVRRLDAIVWRDGPEVSAARIHEVKDDPVEARPLLFPAPDPAPLRLVA